MAFLDTWNALQANLRNGTVIPNWTVHNRDIGEPFTVSEVSDTFVLVDAPAAESLQRVPRADFERIYDCWNDYLHGGMARSVFSPLTRYSKYIISIFHWLEAHTAGRLP
ncbi:MAG TPA: hypothetical protein VH592_20245 [Gemmataceae bacterium]|jgi:hypothetical protein